MPHRLCRQTTGDLPGSVRPHAIGDQEKMPMMLPGTRRFGQHAGDEILVVAAAHSRFTEDRNANTRCRRTTTRVGSIGIVRMRGGRQSTGISQEPFGEAKALEGGPPLAPPARPLILEENAESIPSRNRFSLPVGKLLRLHVQGVSAGTNRRFPRRSSQDWLVRFLPQKGSPPTISSLPARDGSAARSSAPMSFA